MKKNKNTFTGKIYSILNGEFTESVNIMKSEIFYMYPMVRSINS